MRERGGRWAEPCQCEWPRARILAVRHAGPWRAISPVRLPALCPSFPDLLSWGDEGVDVLQHRLQGAVVAHAQVLDLNLPLVRPVLWDQRWFWGPGVGQPAGMGHSCIQGCHPTPRLPCGPPQPKHAPPPGRLPRSPPVPLTQQPLVALCLRFQEPVDAFHGPQLDLHVRQIPHHPVEVVGDLWGVSWSQAVTVWSYPWSPGCSSYS